MAKINTNDCSTVNLQRKPRILVAPLDWGLGHTTRCIPIIQALIDQGAEVILAGEGVQEVIFRQHFPALPVLPLPGYRVHYGLSPATLFLSLLRQTPRLMKAIQQENRWLKKIVREQKIDAVISDNRFGLFHRDIKTVFITHQLMIKSNLGKWIDGVIQSRNYFYIQKFSECWVPDFPGEVNLAGELSHPKRLPEIPIHYVGSLSRFSYTKNEETEIDLLIILSGPEPNRTALENKLIQQLENYKGKVTLIRGLPATKEMLNLPENVQAYNHLETDALSKKINSVALIICRSGYSSVMDLMMLRKKSILIPTPGQGEQEYLGTHLMKEKKAFVVAEKNFDLQNALTLANQFDYTIDSETQDSILKKRIEAFLLSVNQSKPWSVEK